MNRLATLFVSLRALVLASLAGVPTAHGQELPSADDAAWAAAVGAGTADACQQYLEEFPAGRHAEEAFRCLIEGDLDIAPDAAQDLDVY
ncbi:MAG TPA: hypothetical protein VHK45_09240 [Geminicoccaceae bacterium]|jgi:hypothetical protein|nr:hypothetical protein [Geminicoccaceae bacterium]